MPILTPEERLGRVIADRYRLEAILSTGGMGVLFRARDEQADRDVAIKMLNPFYSLEQDRVARFLRETRVATTLHHRHIARVLGVDVDENRLPFLVMELLNGRSLQGELDDRGALPFAEAVAIALPIAEALTLAHEAGVVHRDVKPSNIFLHRDQTETIVPKLLDFGIAKTYDDQFETKTGMMVGTPEYMAPEQAQGGECGPFTDVWGLAAVLYRCLSGSPPLAGGSTRELLANLAQGSVSPLRVEGVAKSACATIDRALSHDPAARYPTMAAFARALTAAAERSQGDRSTEAMPALAASLGATPVESRARPRRVALAIAGLVAALALWSLAIGRGNPSPDAASGSALQRMAHGMRVQAPRPRSAGGPIVEQSPATVDSAVISQSSQTSSRELAPLVRGAPQPSRKPRPGNFSARGIGALATRPSAVAEPASVEDCEPPYTVNEEGIRIYKRQCLRK
jgi:eukaryotic-like serine/threonine-protein kinase